MAKLIALFVMLVMTVASTSAIAAGRIEVPRGEPLELRRVAASYECTFDVRNTGDDPLFISRIAPRTDADDVRLPRRIVARFEAGASSGTIAPHGTARVRVTYTPDRDSHVRTFYGHVMITSTDERAGEVAVGIAAHNGPFGALGRHLLSAIVALPLLAAALLAALLIAVDGGRTGRRPRVIALVFSLASAALALVAWAAFDPELARGEGGDGLQLVERASFARSLGVELFLGVDGLGLPLVIACAIAMPCGVLASWEQRKNPSLFFAQYMLLCGASLGALVSIDGAMFFACLALALTSAFMLASGFGKEDAVLAASRMLVLGGVGLALFAIALGAVHASEVRTFLVDGSPLSHAWSFPELARIDFAGSQRMLFGAPVAKTAFVLALAGLGLVGAVFPFHSWLAPVMRSAPPAVSAMIAIGVTRAAMLGAIRMGMVVLPESMRWASTVIGAIGAAGAIYAAVVAIGERDLAGTATFGLVSLGGAALVGASALTPEGTLGATCGIVTSGCAVAAAMLVLGALHDRIETLEIRNIRGLALESPLLAGALGIAALAVGAVPLTATFWTTWLVGIGAVVREPGVAIAALVAAVLLAVSQTMPVLRVVRGRLPTALHGAESLAPYGGRVPDLRARELAAIAPLLVLLVVLGLYPAPLLGRAANTARDMTEQVSPNAPN